MITSIIGRLIKKPEVAERIQIPGKHVVNFTLVENRTRGERRLSVFFNLSLVLGTEAQFELAMRLEKGTVLLFSSPRITYVRQTDKSETEQTINVYAEAENFKIVAGAGEAAPAAGAGHGGAGGELLEPADEDAPVAAAAPVPMARRTSTSPPAPSPVNRSAPRPRDEATQTAEAADRDDWGDDPFAEEQPARARDTAPRPPARTTPAPAPARPAATSRQEPAGQPPQSRRPSENGAPPPTSEPSPSAPRNRRPTPPPPPDEEFSDLEDPFAESEL